MKILYVVGCTHNGSTLFGRILNQHSRIFDAGELQYLDVYWGPTGRRCSCGEHAMRCPVWSRVFWRFVDHDLRRFRIGRVSTERTMEWIRALAGETASRGKSRFVDDNRRLFEAIAEATGAEVVIDTSKSVWRLLPFWREAGFPVYTIHLVRSPETQIASRLGRSKRGFWRAAIGEYARVNGNVRLFFGRSDRYRRVRWEDFVDRPRESVREIAEWLGLEDEDPFDRPVAEAHDIGGNPHTKRNAADLRPDPSRHATDREFRPLERAALGLLRRLFYRPA